MYLSHGIVSGGLRMVTMAYGETWRIIRGIIHNGINNQVSRAYVPYQDLESKSMLLGLLEQPSGFVEHIQRYTNSVLTQMVFGFRTLDTHDPTLEQLFDGLEEWSKITGSQTAAVLDVYPILRRLPDVFFPLRRYARMLHNRERRLYSGFYQAAKKRLEEGRAKPCICSDIVRAQKELNLSDGISLYITQTLMEAGSDTSAATLIGFIQAMLIYPEVYKLGQAEIDRVCGDRIPDLNDLENLPYVRGCMKESLRWMPTAILGVPHATTRDDEYLGYHIPKGATVMLNVWAIHHDPSRYREPHRFDPARWANDQKTSAASASSRDPSERDHFVFGAGRRICQGMYIADRNLFLAISRLLWAFDIDRAIDPSTGTEIVPEMGDLTEGLLSRPVPFPANVKPRSQAKADAVRREWDKMTELLDDEMQWKTVPEGLVWKDYVPHGTVPSL